MGTELINEQVYFNTKTCLYCEISLLLLRELSFFFAERRRKSRFVIVFTRLCDFRTILFTFIIRAEANTILNDFELIRRNFKLFISKNKQLKKMFYFVPTIGVLCLRT